MNFLKISGLVIGTGSVVGGTGAGVYYGVIKSNKSDVSSEVDKKVIEQEIAKIEFVGKLVFEKKTSSDSSNNYLIKLFTTQKYSDQEKEFNKDKDEAHEKYGAVNKVIEISHKLKFSELETKLKEILGKDISLTDAKQKISSEKVTELKSLLGEEIYKNLKTTFTV